MANRVAVGETDWIIAGLEWTGAALGLANIILVARRSIWNFPVALAMVALYAPVFAAHRLYSDALLQAFFFAINLYGWRAWKRADAREGEIVVRRLSRRQILLILGALLLATLLWAGAMAAWTDAALPWLDGAIAVASIAAQLLLARRFLENWILWIAIDAASIAMYAMKDLYPTMILYTVLLGLAIWGLMMWRRAAREGVPA